MIYTYYLIVLPLLLGEGGIFGGVLIKPLSGRGSEEEEEAGGRREGTESWREQRKARFVVFLIYMV